MRQGLRATSSSPGRALARALALACSVLAAGCAQKIQEQYAVEIVGPIGVDYLMGATAVALDLSDKELSRTGIGPGRSFSVTGGGINTTTTTFGEIGVRAVDAMDHILAFGKTPELD